MVRARVRTRAPMWKSTLATIFVTLSHMPNDGPTGIGPTGIGAFTSGTTLDMTGHGSLHTSHTSHTGHIGHTGHTGTLVMTGHGSFPDGHVACIDSITFSGGRSAVLWIR